MITRWRAELATFATLLLVYIATLAPGVTLWDSGEFLAAIHSLGIPHPPGTPLYVLVANLWARALWPLVGFAYAVNLLSAVCTALACTVMANLFVRWTGDRVAAYAAAVCAGAMSSVWLSATETEVYSAALMLSCLIFWIAERSGDNDGATWLLLGAYATGLAFALHLTALLTVPAALYVAASRRSWLALARKLPAMIVVFILGASAVIFMYIRAKHDPSVNQGNPSTLSALVEVLLRRQYSPAPLWPRQAPVFIQIGNLFEYADWQVALGLAPDPPPTVARTAMTILFGMLGVFGFIAHRRSHRRSWIALVILFATGTVGVLAYLNLKASPSYGGSFLPVGAKHEARERDYFFALAFLCWGLWSGFGAVRLARRVARRTRLHASALPATIGALAAFIPVVFNWSAVSRREEPGASEALRQGMLVLVSSPRRAVILAHGDNETYPVWYLQEVKGVRRDATVVVVPLLPAGWYRDELARRQALLAPGPAQAWRGTAKVVEEICDRAHRQNRPVYDAAFGASDKLHPKCDVP